MNTYAPPLRYNRETGKVEGTHAIFLGQTGFGKTYLARQMLEERQYVVVHDGKRTFRDKAGLEEWDKVETVEAAIRSKRDKIIYSPVRKELRDRSAQDYFWEWVYRRGHTTTFVDEGTLIADGQDMPDAAFDIYATGRESGNEIWLATQQPVYLPNICYTQAGIFYVFFHKLNAHRQKVRSFVPLTDEQVDNLGKEQFYAFGESWRVPEGPLHYNPETTTIERLAA